jgi:hypothetical protein
MNLSSFKPALIWGGLAAVLLVGFFVRFDNLGYWRDNPELYFFGEEQTPLTLTVDAYYFMDGAKDIIQGRYSASHETRLAPQGYTRSAIPPMISVLLAGVSYLTGTSLEWGAVLLPPVFSLFLGLAAFLLGRELGMRFDHRLIDARSRPTAAALMGLATALATLLSPLLAIRGTVGWFDTDTLNVAFVISAAYLSMRFESARGIRGQIFWFAAWGANVLLAIWCWHTTTLVPLGLSGLPMLFAILLIGRRSLRRITLWAVLSAALLILAATAGGVNILNPASLWNYVSSMWAYISGDTGLSPFPAAATAVSEQHGVTSLFVFAQEVAGGPVPLACGALGLCFLCVAGYRSLWSLTALIFVAALSFTANRFLIFAAPLFGLGVGATAFLVWSLIPAVLQRFTKLSALKSTPISFILTSARVLMLGILATTVLIAPYQATQVENSVTPRRHPVLLAAMATLRDTTPQDAIIWASWGHGHPMVFYSERSVIADGMLHPADTVYALNLPLAAREDRLAANWINFFSTQGRRGLRRANALFGTDEGDWATGLTALKQLLREGPDDARITLARDFSISGETAAETLTFVFPPNRRPVYLFLEYLQTRQWTTFYWGLWDPATGTGPSNPFLDRFSNLRQTGPGIYTATLRGQPFSIDLTRGTLTTETNTIPLRTANIMSGTRLETVQLNPDGSLIVDLFLDSGFGLLGPVHLMDTVFTRLFYELRSDNRYFQPVDIRPDLGYGVWRVNPDSPPERPAAGPPVHPG